MGDEEPKVMEEVWVIIEAERVEVKLVDEG